MCGSLQLRQEGERQTLLLWTAVELNELQGWGGERGRGEGRREGGGQEKKGEKRVKLINSRELKNTLH